MKIRGQKGFSLVGVLVAVALAGIMAMGAAEILSTSNKLLQQTRQLRDRDRVVGNLLNNVIDNLSLFQRDFNTSDTVVDNHLSMDRMPYAWDDDRVVPTSECRDCPGRMGFVMQPLDGRPSINRLTVRLTHRTLISGHRDYVFIIADD